MTKATAIKELEVKVQSGITWLNKEKPGWHKGIDLKILDLSDSNTCVCGQVFGNYVSTVLGADRKMTPIKASARGFDLQTSQESKSKYFNFDNLQVIWYREISKLQNPPKPKPKAKPKAIKSPIKMKMVAVMPEESVSPAQVKKLSAELVKAKNL